MAELPEPVRRLTNVLKTLPGVRDSSVRLRAPRDLQLDVLTLPGEFADLPHAALRRTNGGLKDESLLMLEIRFDQNQTGWIALEFLAWWVRDQSRSGQLVQMRPQALPPVAYGTQLGRTLKFAIEWFMPTADRAVILSKMTDVAKSIEEFQRLYANAIASPTQAQIKDVESLKRAAANDDASAQFDLAMMHASGRGVPKDLSAAAEWMQRAAKWGHPDAMLNLGLFYDKGSGVPKDDARAFEWFTKAAKAGVPLAFGCVARGYELGRGVPKDLAQAAEWYRRGADAGEPSCQAELGECCELGKGVAKDPAQALHWYDLALKAGLKAVQPAIDRLRTFNG